MYHRSIRITMAIVFAALALIGGLSVGVSLWATQAQQHDALVLNLAGRQRMLSQKMTKEAWLGLLKGQDPRHLAEMHTTVHQFEEGLRALMDGQVTYAGTTVSVPPATDPAFRAALEEVWVTWEPLHTAAHAVLENAPGSPAFTQGAEDLDRLSDLILEKMDAVVRVYQTAAEARVARLRWIQLAFLLAGGLVLALGYGVVLAQVLRPVSALERAVGRMERGDLDYPIGVRVRNELGRLAGAFGDMRGRVKAQMREQVARNRILSATLRTLDLDERLDLILDEVQAYLQVEFGAIHLVQGREVVLRCWRGLSDAFRAQVLSFPADDPPAYFLKARIVHERLSEEGITPDFAKRDGIQAWACLPLRLPPGRQGDKGTRGQGDRETSGMPALSEAEGPALEHSGGTEDLQANSHLVTPLSLSQRGESEEGEWLGTILVGSRRYEALGEQEIQALAAMADQLALAVDHARAYRRAQERLARLQTLRDIDRAIIQQLDLRQVLHAVLEQVPKELGADVAAISLLDEGALRTAVFALCLPNGTVIEEEAFTLAESLIHWFVERKEPVIIYDLAQEPRVQMHRWRIRHNRLASYLGVPLIVRDRTSGILHILTTQPRVFADEDVAFFRTLAGQAAIAIENARLYQELRAYAADLERRVAERTAELQAANEQLRQAHEEVSRALEQERELSELKTRFLSMASHEFRTPLAIILSSAELLEHYSHRFTEEKRLTHLHRIQASVRGMVALLEDVLLVGRAEAGRLAFNPQPLDLVPFCRELVEEFQLGPAAGHELGLDLVGLESLPAILDEQLLRHILSNLLSNAVKYSPAGSPVRLALARVGERAVFTVADQGIGIPARDQGRLFEPFHRAGNVGSAPGTGLGLNIVRRAVELHRGSIELRSQEGRGTTVVVELPLAAATASS
jgi:signal transduction histidine kinase